MELYANVWWTSPRIKWVGFQIFVRTDQVHFFPQCCISPEVGITSQTKWQTQTVNSNLPNLLAPGCHDSRYHCKVWFGDWIRGPDGKPTNRPNTATVVGFVAVVVRESMGICSYDSYIFRDVRGVSWFWFDQIILILFGFRIGLGGMKRERWMGLHTEDWKSLEKMAWKYFELNEPITLKSTNLKFPRVLKFGWLVFWHQVAAKKFWLDQQGKVSQTQSCRDLFILPVDLDNNEQLW